MECIFCEIVAGRSPATVHYKDDQVIVIANKLTWVPLMLLALPKKHMTQSQLWQDPMLERMGQVLVKMGNAFAPGGFRVISNFGRDALQTQEHAHIHLLGGTSLGPYA
jgi:histidine triad (HIT) family protein